MRTHGGWEGLDPFSSPEAAILLVSSKNRYTRRKPFCFHELFESRFDIENVLLFLRGKLSA